MPKISSFNIRSTQGTIDQRVQSASLDKSGAGAIAQAVGRIGAQGAQLANQFLLEEKKEESLDYKNTSITNKAADRKVFMDANRGKVDSISGKLPDGTMWKDTVSAWEEDYDKTIEKAAPTDMARRDYKSAEEGNSRASKMSEHRWQFSQQQGKRKTNIANRTDTTAKTLQAQDAAFLEESGSSLTSKTEEALASTSEDVATYNSGQFSEGQLAGELLAKGQNNIVATAGVKSMLRNKRFHETLNVMGVDQILNRNKEFQAKVLVDIQNKLNKELEFVNSDNAILRLRVASGEGKGEELSYDLAGNAVVSLGEGIDITGVTPKRREAPEEFQPGMILNNVTPKQQQAFILEAIRGAGAESKKQTRVLLNKIDNKISTLEARADEEGRESYDPAEGHTFSDGFRQDNRDYLALPDSVADETSKVNLTSRMAGAAIVSTATGLDDAFNSSINDEAAIAMSDEGVDRYFEQVGLDVTDDFKAKVKIKTKELIRAESAKRQREITADPAKYIQQHDTDIQNDLTTAREMELENINSRITGGEASAAPSKVYKDVNSAMESRAKQLGVHLENKFPAEVIALDYEKIKGLQKAGTGNRQQLALFLQESIDSKGPMAESYFKQLTDKGLDKGYLLATKLPKSVNSVRQLEDLSDLIEDRKIIATNFSAAQSGNIFATRVSNNDLNRLALEQLKPLSESFSAAGSFNDRRAEIEAMREILVSEAQLRMGDSTDAAGAMEDAYKKHIGDAFKQGLGRNGGEIFISGRKTMELDLTRPKLDAIAEVTATPEYLPKTGIDYTGMVSKEELTDVANSIASSGQPVNKANTDRVIRDRIIGGSYGVLSPQDSDDGIYLTITKEGARPQVVKENKVNGNSRPFMIQYDKIKNDERVLKIESDLKRDEATGIDKVLDFFKGVF